MVDRPLDESELVERARRGDLRAWESIVRMHQGIAFRTAYLLSGSAADAEEAAQDGFVKAYRALGRFRRGAPLRPWLLRIVANEARNRRRSAGRRERLALRAAAEDRPGDAVPSPEAALLAGEQRERLLAAVERLPDDQRDTVACRYFLELSEEETAAALGVRRGTVKSRLARGLARLREELGEERVSGLEQRLLALGRELDVPADARPRPGRRRAARGEPAVPVAAGRRARLGRCSRSLSASPSPCRRLETSILRWFHLGGATVERVETLPPAVERAQAGGLGRTLTREQAEQRGRLPARAAAAARATPAASTCSTTRSRR